MMAVHDFISSLNQQQNHNQLQASFGGEGESTAVWGLISVDEAWIYCFDPETKQQSQQ